MLLLFGLFVVLVDPASLSGDPAMYAKVKAGGLLSAGASVAGFFVFYFLAGHPDRLGAWALRVERVLPEKLARAVAGLVESFAQGLAVMRRPAHLVGRWRCRFRCGCRLRWVFRNVRAFHMTFGYPVRSP